MGSSSWSYVVAYQPDISAALAELRQATYDAGAYYREEPDPNLSLSEDEFRARLDPAWDDLGINESLLQEWQEAKARPPVTGPDSLLNSQPHSGTHSIIDMANGVSVTPRPFTVSPLSDDELGQHFGTTAPSHDQVEGWMKAGGSGRSGWVGVYVISYEHGRPAHIHFGGYSGD